MFHRVLIANRGEIAVRIARAARELGIEPVFAYSEADADAPYLRDGVRKICIGPGRSAQSYLHQAAVIQAAEQTGCAAIHPGYGFLSENPLFAERCAARKITFVGPRPELLRRMGRKAEAKRVMRSVGLPVIPGSDGILPDLDAARRAADEAGYPVLLKADAGGGGRGMRRCASSAQLEEAYRQASAEAQAAFSSPELYLEKWIEGGRHIEFQIFGDGYGNAVHLGERECSIQRNHQKLLEESPSLALSAEQRSELGARCAEAVRQLGYEGAGTIELLRDRSGQLYFMEMNTRLQVEHPVTEMVYGVDLVQEQLRVAAGHPLGLRQGELRASGHAIEVRVNAEDPDAGFRPSPGKIEKLHLPAHGAELRVETHLAEGYEIPPHYDSLLMKVVSHGPTRDAAADRLDAFLAALRIEGVPTTVGLHRKILAAPAFRRGELDTTAIPGFTPSAGSARNHG
jgi:acetyl-CoA carboxylase biotin carboxylase subunit